jgi:DNA-binding MarR family transcriptional regulator
VEPLAGQLGELVQVLGRRLRHGTGERLAPLGLTPGQGRALSVLSRAGEPLRMAELASRLHVVPRSATGVVDALEERGLVRRSIDPGSRRSILVELTDHGRGTLAGLAEARRRAAEELFAPLDPDEQRQLLALLRTAAAPLE